MSALPKEKESLDVPQVNVNHHPGSLSSLPASDKSYSPSSSPRYGRKLLGLRKMLPWKKKSEDLLNDNGEEMKEDSDDHVRKKRASLSSRTQKPDVRKKRSRSVDHLLTDPVLRTSFEVPSQTTRSTSYGENETRIHSPVRSSVTDEESVDGESGTENFDSVDGMDNTEALNAESQRLSRKIEKTKERMRQLQCSMDENLVEYLQSLKGNPDPELSKKAFEKRNFKSNANICQLQKKLDKNQKALKELETRKQRVKTSHTAKEVLRGVRDGVKAISGKGLPGAVSKFFSSNENITDVHPFSKSDSECHDVNHREDGEQYVGYDLGKGRNPSPKNAVSEEDSYSLASGNHTSNSATASSPRLSENVHPLEVQVKELQETRDKLKETLDKAMSNINAIANSLQEERYKTQRLECQFNELRSNWNDFSELHQNEIMVLRQEMERSDERIETVDYRIVERVAEIDESFDTFDARISKIENLHHQQGHLVDDYLDQNSQAKAVLTKFLSVLLAILTLLFSIFTLIAQGIAPLTRTRLRLLITAILVVFVALWWHNPEHYLVIHFQRNVIEPCCELFYLFTNKLSRLKSEHDAQEPTTRGTKTPGVNTAVT